MKIRILIPLLAGLLTGGVSLKADQYTVKNNSTSAGYVTFCTSFTPPSFCLNGHAVRIEPHPHSITIPLSNYKAIKWTPLQTYNSQPSILEITNPNVRTFTISPEGRITAQ